MSDAFYFGCVKDIGHFLHLPGGSATRKCSSTFPDDFPLNPDYLDGSLLPPKQTQEEGRATLAYINGWTIIAFWDRSVDSRLNSNSAFILRGSHNFTTACEMAKRSFPEVWGRFKFEVRLYWKTGVNVNA